jgi:hypothetical protein
MTVSSSTNKNTYSGDDSTTVFAFTFPIQDESHFTVQEVNDTTGVITAKALTTDYTVSGTGNDTGETNYTSGNITMGTAPATGVTLVIKRNMPLTQDTDYVENDPFPAETHEDALDELTMNDQQQQEELDRVLKFNSAVTATIGEIAAPTAEYFLKRNSTNDGSEWVQLSTDSGLGNVVEDTTPQLGGNLDMNGNKITSPDGTDTVAIVNGTVTIQTNDSTRADITDSGLQLGGSGARVTTVLDEDNMASNSATALSTQQATKAYADTKLANVVDDTTPQLGGSLDVNGNKIVSTSNGDIDIEPNGTGNVLLGNLTFDADQTVGAGQDNYVLTYDNGSGTIGLETASGGAASSLDNSGSDITTTAGINFPDTQISSADVNTLDDYEEGTWTAVLSDGTNNATMESSTFGHYTKIGGEVIIRCRVRVTSLGSVSGDLRVTGLPFTPSGAATDGYACAIGYQNDLAITAGESVHARCYGSNDYIQLFVNDATTGSTAMQGTEFTASGAVEIMCIYKKDS